MKKINILILLLISLTIGRAQYFQGNFSRSGNQLSLIMRPTGTITTEIAYIEICFRYPTATTPAFTISNLTSNTAVFGGGLFMQRRSDYELNGFTYVRFVHNTGVLSSRTYNANTNYTFMTIDISNIGVINTFELASEHGTIDDETVFGVVDGTGELIPPSGDHFFGQNGYMVGNMHLKAITTALPVKFNYVQATANKCSVQINYSTNFEIDNKGFEVQWSNDNQNFITIATLKGHSGTTTEKKYQFNHQSATNGPNYYRIKQTDNNGSSSYSNTTSTKVTCNNEPAITAHPNPFTDQIKITGLSGSNQIQIINNIGQVLLKTSTNNSFQNINTINFPKGAYQITIQASNGFKQTIKVIK